MKCSRCGHVTRTLNAMRKHYLKKHPSAMKVRSKVKGKKGLKQWYGSDSKKIIRLLEKIASKID